ncbi:MAG: hypothetical protein HKP14_06085 [Bacteroidia bacterium]|nr:hypothetical protein [Bacteroidia bacterium]
MLFKRLIIGSFVLIVFSLAYSQVPKKRYKWKPLGPLTTSESDADSGRWTSTGLGWMEDVLIDDDWYAGSVTGGLYKSKNNGKKWKKIDADEVQMGTLCITKIGETLFRCTGLTHYDEHFGFGILKSENRGKSWTKTGLEFKATDLKPVWGLDGNSFDSVLIACTPNCIYVSSDFGQNWNEKYTEEDGDYRTSLMSKHKSSIAFVAGKHLIKSDNNGESWNDITRNLSYYAHLKGKDSMARIAISEDSKISGRFLALYAIGNKVLIDESLDFGDTWTNLYNESHIRGMSIHHTEIAISTHNSNHVIIGGVRSYVSYDNCKSFKQATFPRYKTSNFAHDDIRGIQIIEDNEYVLATDGGLFLSSDSGKSWQDINGKGLNTTMIYGFELLEDGRLLMGCQDLGTFLYDGKNWLSIASMYGDGGDAIELKNRTVAMINGTLRALDLSNLKRHDYIHPPDKKPGKPFMAKLYNYPNSIDTFFYAGVNVWLRENANWTNLTQKLDGKEYRISGFDVNQIKPQQLYCAFDEPTWNSSDLRNKFFKSTDGGTNWTDITANLPILAWRSISSITTNPSNPDEVFVSLAILDDNEVHKVYRSQDGGENWENYSTGLLPYETFKIVHLPNSTGVLLSTLDGMYYRNNQMLSWQKVKGRIPNIAIRDFELDLKKRVLYAATYGTGMWRMKIPKKMLRY